MKIMTVYTAKKLHPENSSTETFDELRKLWNRRSLSDRERVECVMVTIDDRPSDSSYTLKFTDVNEVDKFFELTSGINTTNGYFYILVHNVDNKVRNTYVSTNINAIQQEYERWDVVSTSLSVCDLYAGASVIASGATDLEEYFKLASTLQVEPIASLADDGEYVLQREHGSDLYTKRGSFEDIKATFDEHAHFWRFTAGTLNLYKAAQHVAQGYNEIVQYIYDNTPPEPLDSTEAALDEIIKLSKDSANANTIAVIVNLLKEQK